MLTAVGWDGEFALPLDDSAAADEAVDGSDAVELAGRAGGEAGKEPGGKSEDFESGAEVMTVGAGPLDGIALSALGEPAVELASGAGIRGTTDTGLDSLVDIILSDPGLAKRVPREEIEAAARAADAMNQIIVRSIRETGLANDGRLHAADVRDLNAYIRSHSDWITANYGATWAELHGDDEDCEETGFHLVQNDGATTRLFGYYNAVNTIADGIYHLGFSIDGNNLLNEDANRNASVEDVAWWLDQLLQADLERGDLRNEAVVFPEPTTATGLDQLIGIILGDTGLNRKIATSEIHTAAEAADRMNQILVEAIHETGAANDGAIDRLDVIDINAYLRGGYATGIDYTQQWARLHGDDPDGEGPEGGSESGFHLVQNDGATTRLYARNAVNNVADGIYHIGFAIEQGYFVNEDGNRNVSLETVAWWLEDLLDDDLAGGTLVNESLLPDPAAIQAAAVFSAETLVVDQPADYREFAHEAGMELAEGTVALRFTADDVSGRKTLFSKDARDFGDGGHLTAFVREGRVDVRLQSTDQTVQLSTGAFSVDAGEEHHLAITFGPDGFHLYLDGQLSASRPEFTTGIEANREELAIGANTWMRDARRPEWAADFFDGTIGNFAIYNRALSRAEIASIGASVAPVAPSQGTTGTGLDTLVDIILSDPGLRLRVPQHEIDTAAAAADAMNHIIIEAIRATNLAYDSTLNEADVRDLNAYIQAQGDWITETFGASWAELHGDDEDSEETGFHLVQNDGATTRLLGNYNAVNTIADGIYHVGFDICGNNFLNEDGNRNASVESVAWWLSELLEEDLEQGKLADPATNPYAVGTTGSGLDRLVEIITSDEGLNRRVASSEITAAAKAADAMNAIIIEAIKATGVANDGTINAADVRDVNAYIRGDYADDADYREEWIRLHGDDEDCAETGFHLVQNDGATSHLFGDDNAVNTVADGIYHLGFEICGDRLLNEDGNPNASVASVAYWLSELLEKDLADGTLQNPSVTPYASATTGTGLDRLVEIITADAGLNHKVATHEITAAARAADRMNQILIEAIVATGAASDGVIDARDMVAVNAHIRANRLAEWTALHGDDENCEESGFHLVQNDGATTRLYGDNAVNTVTDGIYHAGFEIRCNRFLNEDGNKNAHVETVAWWLNDLLQEDLASGTLVHEAARPELDAVAQAVAISQAADHSAHVAAADEVFAAMGA